MARVTNFRRYGDTVLARLQGVPGDLRTAVEPHIAPFSKSHAAYETLCDKADAGREARDKALAAVGVADKALDGAVLNLANALVGAGLGTRKNPFAAFGSLSPGKITGLPYDKIVKAVRELCIKVAEPGLAPDVKKALQACQSAANGMEKAQATEQTAQAAFQVAMAARDGHLADAWTRDLNRLKRHAEAAWLEQAGAWRSVFA